MKNKLIYICILVIFSAAGLFYFERLNYQAKPISTPTINVVQPETGDLHYVSDLGFSFDYPRDMFVMVDPDADYRIFVIPSSHKTNKNEPFAAIVISAIMDETLTTPLEWLESPNSGADMSKGYSKLDIDGQEAISINGGTWIVVNAPDNKRICIATLPSRSASQSLLAGMDTIVNSFVFAR